MKHEELGKLQHQYDRLPMEEKVRRLEILADYYLDMHTWGCKFVVDVTKYWPQIEERQRQFKAIEAGAETMAEAMR